MTFVAGMIISVCLKNGTFLPSPRIDQKLYRGHFWKLVRPGGMRRGFHIGFQKGFLDTFSHYISVAASVQILFFNTDPYLK